MLSIKNSLKLIATGILATTTSVGFTADFPSKPIHFYVGFPPGGSTDLVARVLAEGLTEELGQTVLIENKPGAGGTIAAGQTAKAKPDGHTIFLGTVATNVINPILHKDKINFDPINDFSMIGQVGYYTNVILVNKNSEFNDLNDFIDVAKKKEFNYSSPGAGTSPHLTGEYFKLKTDTQLNHVPFSGSGPALNALMGKHVDISFENLPAALNMIKSDQVKVLAITSDDRVDDLPDTPTTTELGVPDMTVDAWVSVMGPAGIPEENIKILNDALIKTLKKESIIEKLKKQAITLKATSPEELDEYIESETEKWQGIIKKANVSLSD